MCRVGHFFSSFFPIEDSRDDLLFPSVSLLAGGEPWGGQESYRQDVTLLLDYLGTILNLRWASKLKALFEKAVSACHRARERGSPLLWSRFDFVERFDALVAEGLRGNPVGKARALLKRLSNFGDQYLAFLYDLSLPFTNNEAERDLRMLKVKLKISGCFRTFSGAEMFCRLRSYILTCGKQGLDELVCLRSIFAGPLIMPQL
jgi:Transposase IS66 family